MEALAHSFYSNCLYLSGTVPRRWFCCGSLLPVFGVRASVTFHLTCAHIILVRFRLLSGHLLENSCSFC